MFAKRHYEFLANVFKDTLATYNHTDQTAASVRVFARVLAKEFENTQPGFKPERFLKACGIE